MPKETSMGKRKRTEVKLLTREMKKKTKVIKSRRKFTQIELSKNWFLDKASKLF